ncbi:MAG: DUF2892 domain-containing protein [Mycobacteriales bacterium]
MTTTCSTRTPGTSGSGAWPTTRVLFLLAGTMTLLSALLSATVSPWFLLLTAFVGLNQLVFVTFGACPASLVIDRLRPAAAGV